MTQTTSCSSETLSSCLSQFVNILFCTKKSDWSLVRLCNSSPVPVEGVRRLEFEPVETSQWEAAWLCCWWDPLCVQRQSFFPSWWSFSPSGSTQTWTRRATVSSRTYGASASPWWVGAMANVKLFFPVQLISSISWPALPVRKCRSPPVDSPSIFWLHLWCLLYVSNSVKSSKYQGESSVLKLLTGTVVIQLQLWICLSTSFLKIRRLWTLHPHRTHRSVPLGPESVLCDVS